MLNIPVKNPLVVQLMTIAAGIAAVLVAHFAPDYSALLSQILNVLGISAIGVASASFTAKQPNEPEKSKPVERLYFNRPHESFPPDEPAELRRWPGLQARLLFSHAMLLVLPVAALVIVGCSAFRSVTPADRADAYAAEARAAELACKAYTFDLAAGLTPDVPAMTKLCAGE